MADTEFISRLRRNAAMLSWLFATYAGTATGGQADIAAIVLQDDGIGVVRDVRRIAVVSGEQEIVFRDIPAEADLNSLQIWAPRARLQLLRWERMGDGVRNASVRCYLRSHISSAKAGVDLIYSMTGLTWSAEYDVWIRSELGEEEQPVSADLQGAVRFENRTRTVFSNVLIRLVRHESAEHAGKPPGFLLLDRRTPLSDAWFPKASEPGPPYVYALATRATIPAQSEVTVPLVNRSRVAAVRRYTFRSDEIALNTRDFLPLREWIIFPYEVLRGERSALPPGRVRVSVGARRERIFAADFKRAVPGSDIRIDLGLAHQVQGRRIMVESTPAIGGFRTETYELRISNRTSAKAIVEIEEQPPAPLGWTVLKASLPYETQMNRLKFECAVPPNGEKRVMYSLKVHEPRW